MKDRITRHHILPKSRSGSSHYNNFLRLKDTKHKALHILFSNQHPIEQLGTIVDMTGQAFTHEFTQDITEFLGERTLEEVYNYKCYVKRHLLDKK